MATPEELAARYAGRWVIGRDRYPDGTYSDWFAEPCTPEDVRYSARDVDKLAELLRRAAGS